MPANLTNTAALASLTKRWAGYLLFGAALHIFAYVYLQHNWDPTYAVRWLTVSAGVMAYHLFTLWRSLPLNHRAEEAGLLPTFGWGTILTLTRGLIIAMLAGFLLLPRPIAFLAWIPALLKIASDFTDFFDGYLARVSNHATQLGLALDEHYDGLGVLIVTLLAFNYGAVPWWYLPVGFARYLYLFGLWLRQRRGQPVYDLHPNVSRRGIAGLQMGFTTAMLFPIFSPPATTIAATLFMLPFLVGFFYDWLTVSGRVGLPAAKTTQFWNKVWQLFSRQLPLLLRVVIAIVLGTWLFRILADYPAQLALYTARGMPHPETWLPVIAILEAIILIMLALGAAGRPVAALALLLFGARLQFDPFTVAHAALLLAYTVILFVGTGDYSLWRPLDYLVSNRAGGSRSL